MFAQRMDSIAIKHDKKPLFLTVNLTEGGILPTEDFISHSGKMPLYTSSAVKFGVSPTGTQWQDIAYGMPYYGVGLYYADFHRSYDIGRPFSVFFLQGGLIGHFKRYWSLNYEWNLGVSFNWKPYDVNTNPENIVIGSKVNVHVAGMLYFRWRLNPYFDLHMGAAITHFSNGASRLPNSGINTVSPFVELKYNINPAPQNFPVDNNLRPPLVKPHLDYDVSFTMSSRQARIEEDVDFAFRYLDRNFQVFGFSFSPLFVRNYKYKWGPSLEVVYDESAGIELSQEVNPLTNQLYERVIFASFPKKLSVGLSVKGEISMPRFSLFAQFGIDLLHANKSDKRMYQIAGIKLYLIDQVFATFGIRADKFSRAQYLYWNIGYTFKGKSNYKQSLLSK